MNSDLTLAAMSGGVDSSVTAALLLERGHKIVGVTMSVWEPPENVERHSGACCSTEDTDDARRVAEKLGIPHYSLNVKNEFKEGVIDNFVREYLSGRTPNPCVKCNQILKFDHLFQKGERFGARYVATGHYARIGSFMGSSVIMRGIDRHKDQSYFLFSTPPDKLGRILFPLGELSKEETRKLAHKYGLNVADKKESQEICFIPDDNYAKFIEQTSRSTTHCEGDIVRSSGEKLGRHQGFMRFTIGQRKGLGIASSAPLYVIDIVPERNQVVVGEREEVFSSRLLATDMNWFVDPHEIGDLELTAKIRSRSEDSPAEITIKGKNSVSITFAEPQLAITPGQGVAIYHGQFLLGGGWIERGLN
ncbi:tRNA-specific 2-thiouridylase MnmA [hydrothermal vent metagenome]|uniref:tRNA-specific 2-thiouridylase MnmA n=1 Tax=hydrothermal vent metagenome TaxID=652676 RepID=A0A3B1CHL3_9ZZZZ